MYRLIYENGYVIQTLEKGGYAVNSGKKAFNFHADGKPVFPYSTGGSVTEFVGRVVLKGDEDYAEVQSWAEVIYKPHGGSNRHYHHTRTEEYFIISGQAIVEIENTKHYLEAGEYLKILPGERHQVVNVSQNEALKIIVKCQPAWSEDDFHLTSELNGVACEKKVAGL